ncbi:Hypothetical protein FKW44_009056, partial [Caligus rogercresseyi]
MKEFRSSWFFIRHEDIGCKEALRLHLMKGLDNGGKDKEDELVIIISKEENVLVISPPVGNKKR